MREGAEIRTKRVRKAKTDRQDAQLLLRPMLKARFSWVWMPSWRKKAARASAPDGAGARHEPTASSGPERATREEEGTPTTGKEITLLTVGSLLEPTTERSAEVVTQLNLKIAAQPQQRVHGALQRRVVRILTSAEAFWVRILTCKVCQA